MSRCSLSGAPTLDAVCPHLPLALAERLQPVEATIWTWRLPAARLVAKSTPSARSRRLSVL